MLESMIDSGSVDSDQVLVDPSVLEGADDAPGVELLWLAAASIDPPAAGDVVQEEGVLDSVGPDVLDGELGPPDEVDLLDLAVGEQLLVALDNILEKVEGGVVQRGHPHVLQREEVRIGEGYLLLSPS